MGKILYYNKKYIFVLAFLLLLWISEPAKISAYASEYNYGGIDYSAVFDAGYYSALYPDLYKMYGEDRQQLFNHFIRFGMREGRSGSTDFDVLAYMKYNPDLVEMYGDINLSVYYLHYIYKGKSEGRIAVDELDRLSKYKQNEVKNILISFKTPLPEGTKWSNAEYYDWKGGTYDRGYGCAGFAFMLSDAAFGDAPAKIHADYSNIKIGDILRVNNNTHMVIVLEVKEDSVIVAEGNANKRVHWGREIPKAELQGFGDYIMTRYDY